MSARPDESGEQAEDRGEVAPEVAAALAAYAADATAYLELLRAVLGSRLLLPMVPIEEGAAMGAALLTSSTGRRGLLAFTGIEPLRRWDADARPLPVRAREAAEAALAERAEAVVLDVAGPTRVVIDGEDLAAIARGRTLGFVGDRPAWVPA
ncbi:MAG: SseB family protein [Nocardioides sp.]